MGRNSAPPTCRGGRHDSDHPGIVSLPGSISCFAGHASPRNPASAAVAHPSHGGILPLQKSCALSLLSPGSLARVGLVAGGAALLGAPRISSATSDEFGDHARDGLVKWLPCVGSLHARSMESIDGEVAAIEYVN